MPADISGAIDLVLVTFGLGMAVIGSLLTLLFQFFRKRADLELLKERYEDIMESNRQYFEDIERKIDTEIDRFKREVSIMADKTDEIKETIEGVVKENRDHIDENREQIEEVKQDMKTVKGAVNRNIARLDAHDRILEHFQKMDGKIETLLEIARKSASD